MTDTLNHANLTTYDVPALAQFLQDHFGLHAVGTRGRSLAILHDDRGFVLTLMFDKHMTAVQDVCTQVTLATGSAFFAAKDPLAWTTEGAR